MQQRAHRRFITVFIVIFVTGLALLLGERAVRAGATPYGAMTPRDTLLSSAHIHSLSPLTELALDTGAAISVTKRSELLVDADGSGAPGPGDTLRYTIVVTNSGTDPANSVVISDTLPEGLTLTGDVLVWPVAGDDAYEVLGNTHISVTAAAGVLGNDIDPDLTAIVATAVQTATAEGGDISLQPDGSFFYDPPAGFKGEDWFMYEIVDEDGLTATGRITFTLSDLIWYVDANAGTGGDGRLSAPFQDLSAAESESGVGDVIFLYEGDYSQSFTLQDEQLLVGQGADLESAAELSVPSGSDLPDATANPVIGGSVTAAVDNAIVGLTIESTGTTGLSADQFGDLYVEGVSISSNGEALDLRNGSLSAQFATVSSNGSSQAGIHLQTVSGSINILDGLIRDAGFAGIYINDSSATISYMGDINTSALATTSAYPVLIESNQDAQIVIGGDVSSERRGVQLSNNNGTTITFLGALDLTTGTNIAFDATGGGTVVAAHAGNTAAANGAMAVRVDGVTIGNGGVNFRSVSAQNAGTGIVLQDAGSGGFTVTGEGTTDGSGGTLQNISVRGFQIINTDNISLTNMSLVSASTQDAGICTESSTSGCNALVYLSDVSGVTLDNLTVSGTIAQQSINGINVDGFSFHNSALASCGNGASEGCVKMRNLTGEVVLENVTLGAASDRVVEILNDAGTLDLTIRNSTLQDTQASAGQDLLEIGLTSSAVANVTIENSNFLRPATNGLQFNVENSAQGSLDVSGSTFNPESGVGVGINLAVANEGTLDFNIVGNPLIRGRNGAAVNVAAFDNSVLQGRIDNNARIEVVGSLTFGSAISMQVNDTAQGKVLITGNDIRNEGYDPGIYLRARPDQLAAGSSTGRLDATITDNSLTIADSVNGYYDIYLTALNANTLCADVRNNQASGAATGAFAVRETSGGRLILQGYTGNVGTTWTANGNSGPGVYDNSSGDGPEAGACETPDHPPLALNDAPVVMAEAGTLVQAKVSGDQLSDRFFALRETEAAGPLLTQAAFATAARLASAPMLDEIADVNVGPFDLPAGKAVKVQFAVVVSDPYVAGPPTAANQARVSGSNFDAVWSDDPDTPVAGDATVTSLDATVDLWLTKNTVVSATTPGETVIYELSFGNRGNQHAGAVVISETVPAHTTFNAAQSSAGWLCDDVGAAGETCTLAIGAVDAGAAPETRVFAVDVSELVEAGADVIANVATIYDDVAVEEAPGDNRAAQDTGLEAEPDLGLSIDPAREIVTPGEVITFTMAYTNTGNQEATGVMVTATVPALAQFDATSSDGGWSCAGGGAAGALCEFSGGSLTGGAGTGTVMFGVRIADAVPWDADYIELQAQIADDGANGLDANSADNEAVSQVGLDAAAELELEKVAGAASVTSGETLTYTLTVRNTGDRGATGVRVTESVAAHGNLNSTLSDEGWSCSPSTAANSECVLELDDELAAGDAASFYFVLDLFDAFPAGAMTIENQARVSGLGLDDVLSDDPGTPEEDDATVTALEIRADLAVMKSDDLAAISPGLPITYTIVLTNAGPDGVTNVRVVDDLPDVLLNAQWACEAEPGAACVNETGSGDMDALVHLAPGRIVTFTVSATVDALARGSITNVATVTAPADVTDPQMANNSAADDTMLTPEIDLTLVTSESADAVTAGSGTGNLLYTATITNRGPAEASNIAVEMDNVLPAVGVTSEGYAVDHGAVAGNTWQIADLAVGAQATLTLTLTVGPEAQAGVDAVVFAPSVVGANETRLNPGDDSGEERTSIVRAVDVQLDARASVDEVMAGSGTGNLTFVISATNAGPSMATGVAISNTLTLPAGASLESVTPGGGTSWVAESGSWLVGDMSPGEEATLTVLVTVGPAAIAGQDVVGLLVTLEAVNETDTALGNNDASASSDVLADADLVLALSDSQDPALAGAVMTYTVAVTNNGPSHATNATVEMTLDAGLTHVATGGCDEDPDGDTVCSLGRVDAGTTVTYTHSVAIDGAATGTLTSSATVESDATETHSGDESDSETTVVEAEADLSIGVSAAPETLLAGYAMSYTVTITNSGPSRAVDVDLAASAPGALAINTNSCPVASEGLYLDAGATLTCGISGVIQAGTTGPLATTFAIASTTPDPAPDNNSVTHNGVVYDNHFSIGDVLLTEGDNGPQQMTFTITRTTNLVASAVDVETVAQTASEGDDFAALATTISFGVGGSLTQTVSVDVYGDEVVELDETFAMRLSNAHNGAIQDAEATGTILNDDSAAVTIADVASDEGDAGNRDFVFTVTLSAAVDSGVSMSYFTQQDRAENETGDADYTSASGTLSFIGEAGEQQTITVTVHGDETMEIDEDFFVSLSDLQPAGRDVTFGRAQAVGTILNDDVAVVDFEQAGYAVGESEGTVTISVTLSTPAAYTVTVDYESRDDGAMANSDYTPVNGTLYFAPGVTVQSFTLDVLDDALDEADEAVALWLTSVSAGVIGDNHPATVVIIDDDGEPSVNFTAFAYEVSESVPGAVISVTLSHLSGRDVTVVAASADDTAEAGVDYVAVQETLTIPAGQQVMTFTVPLIADVLDEDDEQLRLTLSDAVHASPGGVDEALLTIVDDDSPPEIGFDATVYDVDEGGGAQVIAVTQSAVSGRDVTVVVESRDGTATAGVDYAPVLETLTIPAGQQVVTFTVEILDDNEEEADETLVLTLRDSVNASDGATMTATVTIVDDDEPPLYIYYFPISVKQSMPKPHSESLETENRVIIAPTAVYGVAPAAQGAGVMGIGGPRLAAAPRWWYGGSIYPLSRG